MNLAIGKGEMLATPLLMAGAYATFANGGTLYAPNIAARIERPDGEIVREFDPRVAGTVDLPPEIRDPIMEGLLGVASTPDGTAFSAFNLPGEDPDNFVDFDLARWPVAGKTGTAEKDGKADFAIFAAFGPTPNPAAGLAADAVPEYAITIVLEEAGFASRTAAPMAARIFQPISLGAVPPAPTAYELSLCDEFEVARQQQADAEEAGITTTTTTLPPVVTTTTPGSTPGAAGVTTTTAPTATTTTVPLITEERLEGICGITDDEGSDS